MSTPPSSGSTIRWKSSAAIAEAMDAAELAKACALVQAALDALEPKERELRGLSLLGGSLDLCLFLRGRLSEASNGLRIASGPPQRARILPELIQHRKDEWIEGETPRRLEAELHAARLLSIRAFPGEKRAELRFEREAAPPRSLVAECFGPQGNWFLLDEKGSILASARRPKGSRKALVPGASYSAPEIPKAPSTQDAALAPPRSEDSLLEEKHLDPTWLAERIAHYVDGDARTGFETLRRQLARGLRRERKGLDARLRGIEERQRNEARAEEMRREAELLLMQPDLEHRGRDTLSVQDWFQDGVQVEIELDPKLTIKANAQKRFERAKRLSEGVAHSERELAQLMTRRDKLAELEQRESELQGPEDAKALQRLQTELAELSGRTPGRSPTRQSHDKALRRRAWRSYRSKAQLPIWVGRTSRDNDELLRKARGHDLWLHAGEGLGGSHVLVRLPRGKTAPLECLLDAAELALHFSKGRGRPSCEILYTPAKWVRKRKGSAPGLVEVQRSKSLRLEHEPTRLARILATLEQG
ncbi:MAG: hypothetical protein CSA62_13750 [Planctomycetota bacterium]|nr:MAG: hypothetical protein CSA62_13750 [Planctomycetota bacterium]